MKRKLRQMANRFRPGTRQVCPECGSASLSHTACPSCGFYRGRQVLDVEA